MVQTTLGIAISLSGLLAALNLSKPRIVLADWWMFGWFCSTAATVLSFFLAYNSEGVLALVSSAIANACLASCSVFLYLYARAIAGKPPSIPIIHFLTPALILVLMGVISVAQTATAMRGATIVHLNSDVAAFVAILPPAFLLINMIYCWKAIRTIDQRASRNRELGSSWADVRDLGYVRKWAVASLVVLVCFGLVYGLTLLGHLNVTTHVGAILISETALIAYVGYSGLRETRYFRRSTGRPSVAPPQNHYSDTDWRNLHIAMNAKRVWRDPHVTPEHVARQVRLSPGQVLNIIQKYEQCSFSDYMNKRRVEDAIAALADPQRRRESVLTIGMDAGFGSKSAYYAAFQKYKGISPAAYRKTHLQ